ncbi:MAG: hypothetical protein WCO78_02975 [Candidatus Roizmanbacteria bacterium]
MDESSDQVLYSWTAPLRPFKKRSAGLLRFFLALALLISAIVFFFGDIVTLLPIWALLFLFYVFAITPPPQVESRLTRFGVESAGVLIRWDVLSHYYFVNRLGFEVLVLVTQAPYFGHRYLVVPTSEVKEEVVEVMGKHLMFLSKPPRTFTDRLIELFSRLVPEDTPVTAPQPV